MRKEGFVRRWGMMCVLKSDQDADNGEEDSRGAAVGKGLCWNHEHAWDREEDCEERAKMEDQRPL